MLPLRFLALMLPVGMMVLCAGAASGQNYPYRPIRIVVPGIGGGSDFMARLIGQGLAGPLGQQVVVENRPTGIIPAEIVSKAEPDGHTLLLSGSGLWLAPFLYDKLPFDPVRDFSPITLAVSQPNILVVNPALPAKSVKELISLAKARPGELNYASGSTGAANHLAAELFKSMAGVNIVRINYKGAGAGLAALIAGEVQVMFVTAAAAVPHIKTGRVRALAVTTARPSALLPDSPTIAASGLPGYESASIYGIFAPGKTPGPIIGKLNREIVRVLNRPEVKEKLFNIGAEVVGSSPAQLAALVKSDMVTSGKLIRDAGIRRE
ncbi:MAG: tripartite tricarboxylate transporter substrate binding protein [Betaproteobacteria bacterium]|nr:tripartite tricarboxylate transporter substrate binding protein [Betaproteobacteria bacterium]